jgi:hypothetical protein
VQVTFATTASDNAGTLHAVIDKYRQTNHVQRASLMSATLASIRLHSARITPEKQDLANRHTWSVAPSAWGDAACAYQVAHGQGAGQSRFNPPALIAEIK